MRPGTGVLQEDPNQPPGRGSGLPLKEGVRKPVQVVGRDTQRMIRQRVQTPFPEQPGGSLGFPGAGVTGWGGGGGLSRWEVSFLPAAPSHAMGRKGLGAHCSLARQHPPASPASGGGSSGRKWAEPRPWQDPSERAQGPGNASSHMYLVHTWPQCKPTHLSRVHVHGLSPAPKLRFPAFLVCAHVCMRVF